MVREEPVDIQRLRAGRLVFASDGVADVAVTDVATDRALPSVEIPADSLPAGITIQRVVAAIAWRKQVDSSSAANSVVGAQQIQVRSDAPGTWRNAITMASGSLATAADATEGGMMIIGETDISAEVTGEDIYEFQWALSDVTGASLTFSDVQTYLIVDFV